MDTDQQVRQRFLEESGEYFEQMEQVLLGLPTAHNPDQQIDIAMRAAHSLKGGAGMMGFTPMAYIAHSLEDFFKILRARKLAVDIQLETLLLQGVDCLKLVQQQLSAGLIADERWMAVHVDPVISQLRLQLGKLTAADEDRLLSEEEDIDVAILVFNEGLEESLNSFEANLNQRQGEALRQAIYDQANHLGDLGLMGNIETFVSLCQSIQQQAEIIESVQLPELRDQAVAIWRRSQSLIQLGRIDRLPDRLNFVTTVSMPIKTIDTDVDYLASEISLEDLQAAFDQIETPFLEASEAENEHNALAAPSVETSVFTQLEQLQSAFEQIESPAPEHIAEEDSFATSSAVDDNHAVLLSTEKKPQSAKQSHLGHASLQGSTLRVAAGDLQQINNLFSTLIIERNAIQLHQHQLNNFMSLLQQRIKALESFNGRLQNWYDKTSIESLPLIDRVMPATLMSNIMEKEISLDQGIAFQKKIKPVSEKLQNFDALEMDRYSELHLMAQEQMETIVQLQEVAADIRIGLQEMGQSTQAIDSTTRQLRKRITRTQMRPFSDAVGHFPRVLRDLAVQYNKKVRLNLEGEYTLFERVTLDLLADPLNHLLRNAFDHGIETEAERLDAGKPTEGTITIQATQLGNQAKIVIRDDGRGIDIDKICDRIRKHGISEEHIARMGQQKLLSTIFDAGFSTAEQVTELSGRGVGMNVVRTNLDTLGGSIRIDTQPGRGTAFTLEIPLSLSVLRIMLFEQQEMVFALPVNTVAELMALSPDNIVESEQGPQLSWQDQLIPLISLEHHLNFNSNIPFNPLEGSPVINHPMVLVMRHSMGYYAVSAQRFWGEQEVATRPILSPLPLPPGFIGATVLGDGRIVPLVDIAQLVNSAIDTKTVSLYQIIDAEDPIEPSTKNSQKTVLVVDDSVHARRFLTVTLEKADYLIEQARDGQEAIDKLLGGLIVDAVLCDVEMPRLDGYGVLDEIRHCPEHQHLPVAMLTSRSSEKHRKLAMHLGASAYFTKPYNEQELLQTLMVLTEG